MKNQLFSMSYNAITLLPSVHNTTIRTIPAGFLLNFSFLQVG